MSPAFVGQNRVTAKLWVDFSTKGSVPSIPAFNFDPRCGGVAPALVPADAALRLPPCATYSR